METKEVAPSLTERPEDGEQTRHMEPKLRADGKDWDANEEKRLVYVLSPYSH
jgi:hypothetical protein